MTDGSIHNFDNSPRLMIVNRRVPRMTRCVSKSSRRRRSNFIYINLPTVSLWDIFVISITACVIRFKEEMTIVA
eukprot:scaffold7181_cov128-Skeletonema_marinoi.AAC.4